MTESQRREEMAFLQALLEEVVEDSRSMGPGRSFAGTRQVEEQKFRRPQNDGGSVGNSTAATPRKGRSSRREHLWANQLETLIADLTGDTVVRAVLGGPGSGKSTLLRAFRTVVDAEGIPSVHLTKFTVGCIQDRVSELLSLPTLREAGALQAVVLWERPEDPEILADLLPLLRSRPALLVYFAEHEFGIPGERVIALENHGEGLRAPSLRRGRWNLADLQLPQRLALAATTVPLAIALTSATMAKSPEGTALKRAGDIVAQDARDPVSALVEVALQELGRDQVESFQALLGMEGPVDRAFAGAILGEIQARDHLKALVSSKVVDAYGDQIEVIPSVRRAAQDLGYEPVLPLDALSKVTIDRLRRVESLDQKGKWSQANTLFLGASSTYLPTLERLSRAEMGPQYLEVAIPWMRKAFESEQLEHLEAVCERALKFAHAQADEPAVCKILGILGAHQLRANDVKKARLSWTERLRRATTANLKHVMADAYTDLAALELEAGNEDASLLYLEQADRLSVVCGFVELEASCLLIRAHLVRRHGMKETELDQLLERTEGLRPRFRSRTDSLFVHQARASLLIDLKELRKAEPELKELLRNALDGERMVIAGWALRKLGEVYEKKNRKKLALDCFSAAVNLHRDPISHHRRLAIARLGEFLGTGDPQKIGATLREAAPWKRTISVLLED